MRAGRGFGSAYHQPSTRSGEILEAALIEPVVLTKHGKEKLYLLSVRDYHRLRCEQRPTWAYSLRGSPEAVHEELMSGIDAILRPKAVRCLNRVNVAEFYYLRHRKAQKGEKSGRKPRSVCVVIKTPGNPDVALLSSSPRSRCCLANWH